MAKNNEDLPKQEKPDAKQHHYTIMIDRSNYKVEQECMTGKELLTIAGKSPIERFQLNVRYKGGKVSKIGYEEIVCFSQPGIEKFMTLPLDQTEGVK
ncbi:MAG: multiubiquitin domain-containing protein [Bacteroidota bacterium]